MFDDLYGKVLDSELVKRTRLDKKTYGVEDNNVFAKVPIQDLFDRTNVHPSLLSGLILTGGCQGS